MTVSTNQKVKSNKKDCKQLATRAAEVVRDILRQGKDYGDHLPVEVQDCVFKIEQSVPPSSFLFAVFFTFIHLGYLGTLSISCDN